MDVFLQYRGHGKLLAFVSYQPHDIILPRIILWVKFQYSTRVWRLNGRYVPPTYAGTVSKARDGVA